MLVYNQIDAKALEGLRYIVPIHWERFVVTKSGLFILFSSVFLFVIAFMIKFYLFDLKNLRFTLKPNNCKILYKFHKLFQK